RVATCTVAEDENFLRVTFDEAQRAITSGQSIVFYDGDEVLGGAIID
ncbi:MAG: tRNA 2-thiouridine(34) synthase MnmA, partial [Selenomonadaceae bacterium]|nr:tRNA 2-thiouridine(34) synthase MnmA [Selenomonadaceae bacterium]